MKRSKQDWTWLMATVWLIVACVDVRAGLKANPYSAIVERNPFGLKPPPPPDPDAGKPPPPPPAPLATVELTGITSILSSKRALLEIVPGPGKPMLKPILAEGERIESVEIVSINVDKNEVVVKNGNITTNLTFKVAKASASGPTPPPPGVVPGAIPAAQSASVPQHTQGSGRNNVMMAGGNPAASPPGSGAAGATGDGFRSIPSRKILSNPTAPQMSAEDQTIAIEQNRRANPSLPFPPTALTPPEVRQRIQGNPQDPAYQNPQQGNPNLPILSGGTTPGVRPGWIPRNLPTPPVPQ